MRKLVVPSVIVVSVLLLLIPAVASASTPTLKSLARTVAALQKQVRTQTTQIKTLQSRVAAKHSILSGSGAPLTTLGAIGDLYLDTVAYQIYGPKVSGGWGLPQSLKGPQGETGATGARGVEGGRIRGPRRTRRQGRYRRARRQGRHR